MRIAAGPTTPVPAFSASASGDGHRRPPSFGTWLTLGNHYVM